MPGLAEDALLPRLELSLRTLLIDILNAAREYIELGDRETLCKKLLGLTEEDLLDLEVEFDHIDVRHVCSDVDNLIMALRSPKLAPIQYISPSWLLRSCPQTRLDENKVSNLLSEDLVSRISTYLSDTPITIRIGIFIAWLETDGSWSMARRLSHCIRGSRAPLLQKLTQLLVDASAAANELQSVKDDVLPMTSRELERAILYAGVNDLFAEFETTSIAAGSIGQGHRAILKSTNETVFVKVKRLGIARIMREEAKIFTRVERSSLKRKRPSSPWHDLAEELLKETSYTQEVANQRRLKSQWGGIESRISIVDILSYHPATDPSVLIMKMAPGTTIGAASIRFPLGLENAVDSLNALLVRFYAATLFYTPRRNLPAADISDIKPMEESDTTSSIGTLSGTTLRTQSIDLQKHSDSLSIYDRDDIKDIEIYSTELDDDLGYAPADPHSSNFHISCCQFTGSVGITVLDTASLCSTSQSERDKLIGLIISISMGDVHGVCKHLDIHDDEYDTAYALYREILTSPQTSVYNASARHGMDKWVFKALLSIIEVTKLVLSRPALDGLLVFGKAQLQLLETITLFTNHHAREMGQLGLEIASPMTIFKELLVACPKRTSRALLRTILKSASASTGNRIMEFTPWRA